MSIGRRVILSPTSGSKAPARIVPETPSPERPPYGAPLRLGLHWALGADDLQWIVLRARMHHGRTKWQPIAFVASTRAVLERVLRENGAKLSRQGQRTLNALNPTFRKWREVQLKLVETFGGR